MAEHRKDSMMKVTTKWWPLYLYSSAQSVQLKTSCQVHCSVKFQYCCAQGQAEDSVMTLATRGNFPKTIITRNESFGEKHWEWIIVNGQQSTGGSDQELFSVALPVEETDPSLLCSCKSFFYCAAITFHCPLHLCKIGQFCHVGNSFEINFKEQK